MKALFAHLIRCAASLLISISLTGCATYTFLTWGRPAPDFGVIEVGASRETVERELGKPKQQEHNIYTYEYNTREPPSKGWVPLAAFVDVLSFGTTALMGFSKAHQAQRAEVKIVYAPNGRVLDIVRARGPRGRYQDLFHAWLRSPSPADDLRSLCLAANRGYAPAQFTQAMRYRYGLWDTAPTDVTAYMWARLAAFGGHPGAEETVREWGQKMSNENRERAEALFSEFVGYACEDGEDVPHHRNPSCSAQEIGRPARSLPPRQSVSAKLSNWMSTLAQKRT